MSLCEWIQEREEVMLEQFDFIPYSIAQDDLEILNEENAPLTWTIPEIGKNKLYTILSEANLLEELVNDYPRVVHQDWYEIPVEANVKDFIFGQEPHDCDILGQMKNYAIDSSLRFIDEDNQISHKYNQKKDKWIEFDGFYCLTVPAEASDEWWFDRLMERIIRDQIVIPNDVIDSVSSHVNNSQDCSFFVAKVKALYNDSEHTIRLSREELAILPKDLKYKKNWTILTNTLTAWNINTQQTTGTGMGLWRGVNAENYTQISSNNRIYLSRDLSERQYFCTYNGEGCGGFVESEQLEHGIMPNCPGCEDNADVILQSLVEILTERSYFAIMGEPINSEKIISVISDFFEKPSYRTEFDNSAVLVVNPYPQTEIILDNLKTQNWTKIPTLSVTSHSNTLPKEVTYNDRGDYNQESDIFLRPNWADSSTGVNEKLASYYSNFYGHVLNLNGNRNQRQKNVLVREIGIKELLIHFEWPQDDEFIQNLRLVAMINQERIVNYPRLNASFIRVNRAGSRGMYSIRRASVRTTRQRQPAFDNQQLIPFGESQPLTDLGMCGFSETPSYEAIPWIISLMNEDEEEWEYLGMVEDLELVHYSEIKVDILPADDILRLGLCRGIHKVIDEIVEQDTDFGTILLIGFAKMVQLLDSNLLSDSSVFRLLDDNQVGIGVDHKNAILALLENAIQDSVLEEEGVALSALRSSLQGVQAQTWQSVLEVIDGLDTNEEKWNLFYASKNLPPNPAVFQYRVQYDDFRRMGRNCRINTHYAFMSNQNAIALFNIQSESQTVDACSWAIPGKDSRICILDQNLVELLECDGAAEYTIGKANFRGVLESAETNTEEVDVNSQWGFAQLIIALKSAQMENQSGFEPFIPQLGEREINHPCQVFTGRQIHLGKGGWDLCVDSADESQQSIRLVTNSIDQGSKKTLLQLLKKIGIRLAYLKNMSIQSDSGIQQLATTFDMDLDELKSRIEALKKRVTGTLLNPWNGVGEQSEAEQWDLNFGQKPEWRSDKNAAIEKVSARKLLRRYTSAIHSLLSRGELEPPRSDDTQRLIRLLGNARDEIKTALYPNVGSLLADEPIIYPPGEVITEMGNLRRKRVLGSQEVGMLDDSKLNLFLGNLLFLTRFSTHRGTMYASGFGLKERKNQTIQSSIHQLLNHTNAWGNDETILLRDVMQMGPRNYLSLRLHKYHAICMVALDDAFEKMMEEEE